VDERVIKERKNEIRRQLKDVRSNSFIAQKNLAASEITSLISELSKLPEFTHARSIGTYYSVPPEPDTAALNKYLHQQGKELFLPSVKSNREMDWISYQPDLTPLTQSNFLPAGFFEAVGEVRKLESLDFLILPAVAVDSLGNRLGKGGGYYDRALAEVNIFSLALIYESEYRIPELITGEFDQKVSAVAFGGKIIRFN
jgi:5-formyltetrahydrofolate cyclo-ligase